VKYVENVNWIELLGVRMQCWAFMRTDFLNLIRESFKYSGKVLQQDEISGVEGRSDNMVLQGWGSQNFFQNFCVKKLWIEISCGGGSSVKGNIKIGLREVRQYRYSWPTFLSA
jgi:hypothetical protein